MTSICDLLSGAHALVAQSRSGVCQVTYLDLRDRGLAISELEIEIITGSGITVIEAENVPLRCRHLLSAKCTYEGSLCTDECLYEVYMCEGAAYVVQVTRKIRGRAHIQLIVPSPAAFHLSAEPIRAAETFYLDLSPEATVVELFVVPRRNDVMTGLRVKQVNIRGRLAQTDVARIGMATLIGARMIAAGTDLEMMHARKLIEDALRTAGVS